MVSQQIRTEHPDIATKAVMLAPTFSWLAPNDVLTQEIDRQGNFIIHSTGDVLSWGSLPSFASATKIELPVDGFRGHYLDNIIRALKRSSTSLCLARHSSDPQLLQTKLMQLDSNQKCVGTNLEKNIGLECTIGSKL